MGFQRVTHSPAHSLCVCKSLASTGWLCAELPIIIHTETSRVRGCGVRGYSTSAVIKQGSHSLVSSHQRDGLRKPSLLMAAVNKPQTRGEERGRSLESGRAQTTKLCCSSLPQLKGPEGLKERSPEPGGRWWATEMSRVPSGHTTAIQGSLINVEKQD